MRRPRLNRNISRLAAPARTYLRVLLMVVAVMAVLFGSSAIMGETKSDTGTYSGKTDYPDHDSPDHDYRGHDHPDHDYPDHDYPDHDYPDHDYRDHDHPDHDHPVIPEEDVQPFILSATQVGSGSVTSSSPGITLAAPGSTSASFAAGTSVTLTATPAAGYIFIGWSGACSGDSPTCTVLMTQANAVIAIFVPRATTATTPALVVTTQQALAVTTQALAVTLRCSRVTYVASQKGLLRVTATNTGNAEMVNVSLVVRIPKYFVVMNATGARLTARTVTWTGLRLGPGESTTRRIQIKAFSLHATRKGIAAAQATASAGISNRALCALTVRPKVAPSRPVAVTG